MLGKRLYLISFACFRKKIVGKIYLTFFFLSRMLLRNNECSLLILHANIDDAPKSEINVVYHLFIALLFI